MASYNTSELKKGLKLEIDGEPFLIVESNFVKPGKGQALYKLKLKNLLRSTVIDRTYKSGDSIDAADVREFEAQLLYRDGEGWVYMDGETYDQETLSDEQIGDELKWLKEGMNVRVLMWNNRPIQLSPPNQVVYQVTEAEPAAKGNTATGLSKPITIETGATINVPAFIEEGAFIRVDTREAKYLERVKDADS